MTTITHDKETATSEGGQVFWMPVRDSHDNTQRIVAEFMSWQHIGYDDFGDFDELSSYKKAKWNSHCEARMAVEVVKGAYQTAALKWLVKADVDFEVYPFPGYPELGDAKIIIADDNAAMRFKLMWCAL